MFKFYQKSFNLGSLLHQFRRSLSNLPALTFLFHDHLKLVFQVEQNCFEYLERVILTFFSKRPGAFFFWLEDIEMRNFSQMFSHEDVSHQNHDCPQFIHVNTDKKIGWETLNVRKNKPHFFS